MRKWKSLVTLLMFVTIWHPIGAHAELSTNARIVARGLNNPRGLAFDPLGLFLFVAEAGLGGTNSTAGACEQAPPPEGPITGGKTGRVSVISPFGQRFTLIEGLPSSQTQFLDILGPTDIEFVRFKPHVLLQAGCSKGDPDVPNAVLKFKGRKVITAADLSDFTVKNPQNYPPDDDQDPEGVPFSFKADGKGGLLVVDANRSTVNRVAPDGAVTRFADLAEFVRDYDTPVAIDIDKHGNVFIGSFSALPYAAGASTIYKIVPTGRISVVARGFTTLIDITFDREGALYVLETSTGNTGEPPFLFRETGRVTRLTRSGAVEVIATGLDFPTAMTLGPDGALYVSNRGHGVELRPGQGEIVRIDLDPANRPPQLPLAEILFDRLFF